jgi:hypothetical protein
MAGPRVPRRARGRDSGRLLDVSRFDRGPRPVGHARTFHIDVGTDANCDAGFHTDGDSDRDATTATDTNGGGAIGGERPVPLTLGKHQLQHVHDGRPERRPL